MELRNRIDTNVVGDFTVRHDIGHAFAVLGRTTSTRRFPFCELPPTLSEFQPLTSLVRSFP